jgi:chromate transporter
MDNVSLWQIFLVFSKIGAFTIGGGYAMLPLIEKEMTDHGWISSEDFQDIIVLAQSAPGVLAVNIAIYTGNKLRGVKGSIVATTGAVLPSFFIILMIAMVFTNFKDNVYVRKFFQGVRPVAVSLILVAGVRMAKAGKLKWWGYAITAATIAAVAFLKVSPAWIIIVIIFGVTGVAALAMKNGQGPDGGKGRNTDGGKGGDKKKEE